MRQSNVLSTEEIRTRALNDGILTIIYKNGDGKLSLNLPAVLPCKAGDMKRIISFMDLTFRPDTFGQILADYIVSRVDPLKEERKNLHANTSRAKQIDKELKQYAANMDALKKVYPDIKASMDAPEKIQMKRAQVYSLHMDGIGGNAQQLAVHDGWTFEKNGHAFDVYRDDNRQYIIILHGTGIKAWEVKKKTDAVNLPDRVFEAIEKAAGNVQDWKETFELHLRGAMEVDLMREVNYYNNAVTVDGVRYPAEYNMYNGKVLVFTVVGQRENGRLIKHKTVVGPENGYYNEALRAACGNAPETVQDTKEEPETVQDVKEEPETVQEPERDPKQARGPVPEKTFIGQIIQGEGWKILFDGEAARTRVMFSEKPTDAARAALDAAGFFYSSKMDSWNKKLTFKAYRAANKLSDELKKIYAA